MEFVQSLKSLQLFVEKGSNPSAACQCAAPQKHAMPFSHIHQCYLTITAAQHFLWAAINMGWGNYYIPFIQIELLCNGTRKNAFPLFKWIALDWCWSKTFEYERHFRTAGDPLYKIFVFYLLLLLLIWKNNILLCNLIQCFVHFGLKHNTFFLSFSIRKSWKSAVHFRNNPASQTFDRWHKAWQEL